jgi:hypothetical protein
VGRYLQQTLRSLRENLKDMPTRLLHYVEDGTYVPQGNVLVKQVAHGVDEDEPGLGPEQRLVESSRS